MKIAMLTLICVGTISLTTKTRRPPQRPAVKKLQIDFDPRPQIVIHSNNIITKVRTNLGNDIIIQPETYPRDSDNRPILVSDTVSSQQQGSNGGPPPISYNPVFYSSGMVSVMTYDGTAIEEPSIEPGPDHAPFRVSSMDPEAPGIQLVADAPLLSSQEVQQFSSVEINYDDVRGLQADLAEALDINKGNHVMVDPEINMRLVYYLKYLIFLHQKSRKLFSLKKVRTFTTLRGPKKLKFDKKLFTVNSLRPSAFDARRVQTTTTTDSPNSTTPTYGYTGSAAGYKNIPNLLVTIQGISAVYNSLYSGLPTSKDAVPKDTLTSIRDGLLLYAKLRNFIIALTVNRDKTKSDLQYVLNNLNSIKLSKNEVLGFYDLLDRYNGLKLSPKALDPNFVTMDTKLGSQTDAFSSSIRNAARSVQDIYTIQQNIEVQTQYLRTNMDNNEVMDDLKKIDATILLLPTLIDYKLQIDVDIQTTQTELNNIQNLRAKLIASVNDMDLVVQGKYVPPSDAASGHAGLVLSSIVVSLLLLF